MTEREGSRRKGKGAILRVGGRGRALDQSTLVRPIFAPRTSVLPSAPVEQSASHGARVDVWTDAATL